MIAAEIRILPEPPAADILYIMQNLRDLDWLECSATSYSENPEEWAARIIAAGPFQWGVYLNGTPVCSIGATPRWPGNWNAWCLGTAEFSRVALSVTKHIRRFMIPAVTSTADFQRADAWAVGDYATAHKWLGRALGATHEAALANWGKNGETFHTFVWLREATKPTVRTAVADMRDDPHGLPV